MTTYLTEDYLADNEEYHEKENRCSSTPAEKGILAARADVRKLEAEAKAAAIALDDDGYPTWEKIADVHRKASKARLEKIKDLQLRIAGLEEEIESLEIEREEYKR